VVVTARRREESLQDVPVSVTALSAETLQAQSIQSISDIEGSTPSLTIRQSFGGSANAIIGIRGQVQTDGTLNADPSIGLYYDDVYLGRSPGSLLNLFDVERVEVLAGPQGTLYGRNTTGGAVKIIANKANPSEGYTGFVKGGLGNYKLQNLEGAINLPLIADKFALRVAATRTKQDGFTTTYKVARAAPNAILAKGDTDDTNQWSYRLGATWNIADGTKLVVAYDYNKTSGFGQLLVNQVHGDFITAPNAFEKVLGDFYKGYSDEIGLSESKTKGYSATLSQDLGSNLSAKLVYAHRSSASEYQQDSDGGVGGSVNSISTQSQKQDSAELQFTGSAFSDKLDYTGGFFWFKETGVETTQANAFGLGPFIRYRGDDVVNKSWSAYTNLNYQLTERLGFQAGVRYTEDKKSMLGANAFLLPVPQAVTLIPLNTLCLYTFAGIPASQVKGSGGSCTLPFANSWTNTSYLLGADYKLTEDVLLYGHYSTGYRSGGFSLRGANLTALAPFDEEKVRDIEIGVKGDYFDRRVRLNLAFYRTKYDSLQRTLATSVPIVTAIGTLAFPGTRVYNPADATLTGFEASGRAIVTDNFELNFTADTIHTKFKELVAGPGTVIPNTPKYQLSLGAMYTLPVSYGEWMGRLDYSYRGKIYASGADASATRFDQGALLNARVALKLDDDKLNIAVWARNLLDKKYYESGFYRTGVPAAGSAANTNTLHPGAPRMWGVEVTKKF